ncbi:MAG TPA: hydrogenase expression/formation protein HypE [Syntrophomonadaceae bacterium]|nr:hydrogenase expression/formation protein HypE [Syntrophomonadaceae bacterium]
MTKAGRDDVILLGHGSGGTLTNQLVKTVFQDAFGNPILDEMLDAAVLEVPKGRIAFTTDSFVVDPIFFPGGDIGKIAVCGTVNDLAVSGAEPLYLSAGFIIEEGFPLADLRRIVHSMKEAAESAGVRVVTGDTKVVGRGSADKIFINTTGIGLIPEGRVLSPRRMQPGDAVLVSGSLGEHGLAILARREGLSFTTPVVSDCAPLRRLTRAILEAGGDGIRCMRDPTRGGLATTLNELAAQSGQGILVHEELLPLRREVVGACEMLGIDPIYLANEGKVIVVAAPDVAERVLEAMRGLPEGTGAVRIGEVIPDNPGLVLLETELGATRIITMLEGEPLPRIC